MAVRKVIPVWSVKSNIGDANILIEFIGAGDSPPHFLCRLVFANVVEPKVAPMSAFLPL